MRLTQTQTAALRALAARIERAPHGARSELVAQGARELGLSRATLYRHLRTLGVVDERKTRADAGRRCVTREQALAVAGLVHVARRANGKQTMTIKRAADIVAANGIAGLDAEGAPSVSTVARAMRDYGCHPGQLKTGKATGRMRSPHPNWCWQIDASVCVLYYLPGGKMRLLDERMFNERKPGRLADIGDQRITRYVVVDHCTGALYLRYALERGESALGVLTTLIEAMADRGERDPMHGVPFRLYLDKSGGNKSGLVGEFCTRMNIEALYHAAGAANATGAVEVAQNIVEREFESRLRFTDVRDLEGLQAMADRWRRHFNAHVRHTRHKMTRNQAWLRIKPDQLRTASREAMQAVAHWRAEERTVSRSLTISVDTRLPAWGACEYDLRALVAAGIAKGDKVRVELNPFEAPAVTIIKAMPDGVERRWSVSPINKDEFGFDAAAPVLGESYASQPDTRGDKALKEIEAAAAPTAEARERGEKHAYSGIDVMADVREAALTLRAEGRDILGAAPVAAPVPLTLAQAVKQLRGMAPDAFARNAVGCRELVEQRYASSVPESALRELADELSRRFGAPRIGRAIPFTDYDKAASDL